MRVTWWLPLLSGCLWIFPPGGRTGGGGGGGGAAPDPEDGGVVDLSAWRPDNGCWLYESGDVWCEGSFSDPRPTASGGAGAVVGTLDLCCTLEEASDAPLCWDGLETYTLDAPGMSHIGVYGNDLCGLRDGRVACWDSAGRTVGPELPGVYTALSLSSFQACGIRDGDLECEEAVEPPPRTYVDVAVDDFDLCALTSDGAVLCDSTSGVGPPGTGWHTLTASEDGWCAIRGGEASCWDDSEDRVVTPPRAGPWVKVVGGVSQGCGLREDGTGSCW